jgi:uncharacterized protein
VTLPPATPPPPPPGPRGAMSPGPGPGRGHEHGDPAWPGGGVRDGSSAADAFPVPFSAIEGFFLVLWSLIAQFLVILPAVVLGLLDPAEGGPMLLVLVITSQGVGVAGALGYLAARGRLSWRLLGPIRPAARHVAIGLGVGVGGFVLVNLLIQALLQLIGPVDPPEQQLLTDVTAGGVTTALAVIAAVVMAPLVEEVVFRGVLFQGLKRKLGLWPGALLSGLLFAIVHVEVSQPIYSSGLFLLGVLFAWTMHRFGSLLVPLAAHATFNGISVGLTILGVDPGQSVLDVAGTEVAKGLGFPASRAVTHHGRSAYGVRPVVMRSASTLPARLVVATPWPV